MDIYSFGMILWELLHDAVPFDGDLNTAKTYVCEQEARPKISETVDFEVAKIIRLCWQKETERRPPFQTIFNAIKGDMA